MSGNEAIGLGAIAAGCKFFSAYPMTPSSSLLHWMASNSSKYGVVVKQAEDEISAINMAIGASFVGVRSMTATSGGGFSLMVEALGLAGMTETPLVIVEAQRPGPSTGMPTKTEQGDLNMMLGASQGDFPRIILAPLNVEDCFYATSEALNLADKYQCPVIIASDQYLSERLETLDDLNLRVPIDRGPIASDGGDNYKRYELTENGISPRAFPSQKDRIHVATSDEHSEDGSTIVATREDPLMRKRMMEKRMKKLDLARKEMKLPNSYVSEDSEITIIGWGSTQGPIREAIDILAGEGIRANSLEMKYLCPLPAKELSSLLSRCKRMLMVENYYTGQLARLIRGETGIAVEEKLLKYNGEPFYPIEIASRAKEVLKHG